MILELDLMKWQNDKISMGDCWLEDHNAMNSGCEPLVSLKGQCNYLFQSHVSGFYK